MILFVFTVILRDVHPLALWGIFQHSVKDVYVLRNDNILKKMLGSWLRIILCCKHNSPLWMVLDKNYSKLDVKVLFFEAASYLLGSINTWKARVTVTYFDIMKDRAKIALAAWELIALCSCMVLTFISTWRILNAFLIFCMNIAIMWPGLDL